jgi:molybdate transport system substrate-binding protein
MIRAASVLVLLVALTASSCSLVACACSTPVIPVRVFGAASLTSVLDQAKASYEASHSVVEVTISTGSSAALRTQIEQGAEADVFLSADTLNPQALVDAGVAAGDAIPFATNLLTIVVPDGNPGHISSAADLAREDVTIIAAGEDVPITRYAEEAVENLAGLPGYPADFAAAYQSNVASREDNVGAVTAKIGLGEGDAAIVYVTDALAASLATVEIPAEATVVATYAGVVLRDAASADEADEFLDWLRGPTGQAILAEYGFSPAP